MKKKLSFVVAAAGVAALAYYKYKKDEEKEIKDLEEELIANDESLNTEDDEESCECETEEICECEEETCECNADETSECDNAETVVEVEEASVAEEEEITDVLEENEESVHDLSELVETQPEEAATAITEDESVINNYEMDETVTIEQEIEKVEETNEPVFMEEIQPEITMDEVQSEPESEEIFSEPVVEEQLEETVEENEPAVSIDSYFAEDTLEAEECDPDYPHLTQRIIDQINLKNEEKFQELREGGDSCETERPIQHYVSFDAQDDMETFKNKVINRGFVVTQGEQDLQLVVLHISSAEHAKLVSTVLYLADEAYANHGVYEGWNSQLTY